MAIEMVQDGVAHDHNDTLDIKNVEAINKWLQEKYGSHFIFSPQEGNAVLDMSRMPFKPIGVTIRARAAEPVGGFPKRLLV